MIYSKRRIAFLLTASALFFCIWIFPLVSRAESSNAAHRLTLNFNEAMNRCLLSNCSNAEEVIAFFSDDCSYLDDSGQLWKGKAEIRKHFAQSTAKSDTSDRIEGLDVFESMVTLRLQRRRLIKAGKYDAAEIKPHMQILLLSGDKIVRLISVMPPDKKQ